MLKILQARLQQYVNRELYFSGAPKSLQMVTAAMKLTDAYSLEGKFDATKNNIV